MLPNLTANEARVIGCLMEKSVVTPDQYPLTLNALTNACNQKSSRDPVMSLEQGAVQRVVRDLQSKHLLRVEENFKRGVEKYSQRLCSTPYSEYKLDAAQFAIICLLLLRGPQTPGELRTRSARLHEFADNAAVVEALSGLLEQEGDALVAQLPRTPGRREPEYMHLFCGPLDIEAHREQATIDRANATPARDRASALAERVDALEADVALLKERLNM